MAETAPNVPTAPKATAPPVAEVPTGKPVDPFVALVGDLSNEDLCVKVTRELLRRNLIVLEQKASTTKGVPGITWGAWEAGVGSGLYKSFDLTPVQSAQLRTERGVPMALSFRATIIDVVPQAASDARRRERKVMTVERDIKRAKSTSTEALLEELNARRRAEGKSELTEI